VQLHVHLKKWTLKFKLLYLRNYISYFNKICSICCVNTRIQSLKVWLKSVLSWLKYSIFSRGLFFIGAPCSYFLTTLSQSVYISLFLPTIHASCRKFVHCDNLFYNPSCGRGHLAMLRSVRLSVRPSVCLSMCVSHARGSTTAHRYDLCWKSKLEVKKLRRRMSLQ